MVTQRRKSTAGQVVRGGPHLQCAASALRVQTDERGAAGRFFAVRHRRQAEKMGCLGRRNESSVYRGTSESDGADGQTQVQV